VDCPACEYERTEALRETDLAPLPFRDAAPLWLAQHQRYIAPRTHADYKQYIAALNGFFATIAIKDIHIGHLRSYQDWRAGKAGPSRINMELSTLQQVLKEARLWKPVAALYKPLPVKKSGSGKCLTPEQEDALLDVCLKRTKWELAGHCLRIMLRTGCGFGELRHVRRSEIDLANATITFSHAPGEYGKNEYRERTVPLTPLALDSAHWLVERWRAIGGNQSDQYILPARAKARGAKPDFYEPMVTIRRAAEAIYEAAGIPFGLGGYRIYDCRPTAITKTLSSGKVSIHTAQKLFGHVSEAMQKRYYKPQMDTLREAVAVLETETPKKSPQPELVKKAAPNVSS